MTQPKNGSINLLASDCDRPGSQGFNLHSVFKQLIRWTCDKAAATIGRTIKVKEQKGFINPEVKILYDICTEVINQERFGTEEEKASSGNCRLFTNLRDCLCVLLDEDSYYLLRFFYTLELIFEKEKDFRLEMHKERAYWKWPEIRDALMAQRQELEKDDNAGCDRDKDCSNNTDRSN